MSPDTISSVSLKRLALLAGPILLANLATVSVGTIDTVMVGQRSADELAGVALGASIALWISITFTGILQGLSPLAGYNFGAQTYQDVGRVHQQSWYLALLFCVPAVVLTRLVDFWVELADVTPAVGEIAKNYMLYVSWAVPAILLSRVYIAVNAAVSRPAATTVVLVTSLLLKIPLNLLMMNGIGQWPGLGGVGVGMATAISQWVALFFLVAIWKVDKYYARMRLKVWERINWSLIGQILRIGIPMGLAIFFEIAAFSLMAILIARMGTIALGAHQIVSNLIWLYYDLPLSVGVAGSVMVAQNLGRQRPEESRQAVWMSLKVAGGLGVMLAAITWFAQEHIIALYTSDAAVQQMALSLLSLGIIYHLADAMQCSSNCLLRGYRITVVPMILHSTLLCGLGLGLGYYLATTQPNLGPKSYWISMSIALWIEAVFMMVFTVIKANARANRPLWSWRL